jgi:hypothetical protein
MYKKEQNPRNPPNDIHFYSGKRKNKNSRETLNANFSGCCAIALFNIVDFPLPEGPESTIIGEEFAIARRTADAWLRNEEEEDLFAAAENRIGDRTAPKSV